MRNFAEKITKNLQEILHRQIPREDAKKIAKVATVIVTVVVVVMCYMIITAQSRVSGVWQSGRAYHDKYADAGNYYIDFGPYGGPYGDCWVSFDVKDYDNKGWGCEGEWAVTGMSMTGIYISVRTDWEERLPNKTVYHYNPFTNRIRRDSLVYKRIA